MLRSFFALTFVASWTLWLVPVALGRTLPALVVLGAFAPSVVGSVIATRNADADERRRFWRRAFSFRGVSVRWVVVAVLVFPVLDAVAFALYASTGGMLSSAPSQAIVASPGRLLAFMAVMAIGGPLSEELGWRGYALQKLLDRHGPARASILLGAIWAAWHLPLFLVPGTTQHAMGIGSSGFFAWTVGVLAMSVIFTWVYEHTQRSTLACIVLHFMANSIITFAVGLGGALPVRAAWCVAGVQAAAAVAVMVWMWWRREAPAVDASVRV